MMLEQEENNEFVHWFERWRAELKSRVLCDLTPREEGQRQAPARQAFEFKDSIDTAFTREKRQ
jgi:hypothetical protein